MGNMVGLVLKFSSVGYRGFVSAGPDIHRVTCRVEMSWMLVKQEKLFLQTFHKSRLGRDLFMMCKRGCWISIPPAISQPMLNYIKVNQCRGAAALWFTTNRLIQTHKQESDDEGHTHTLDSSQRGFKDSWKHFSWSHHARRGVAHCFVFC